MANLSWLELSQGLRRESGVQGTGPSAVTGQTGIYERIVNWTNQAWIDLQSMHDNWKFMLKRATFTTSSGTREYSIATDLKRPEQGSFTITDSAGTITELEFIDYSLFRSRYRTIKLDDDKIPCVVTINPEGKFWFPDYTEADYTIGYEYFAHPTAFSASTDVATIPEAFDQIIIYKALIDYGHFWASQEAVQHGQIRYQDLLARLKEDQLIRPTIALGRFIHEGRRRTSRYTS